MPRVDFYILPESMTAQRFACDMAARVRRDGLDVLIHAPSRAEAVVLDGLLWTFRDISFLPHALADDADAGPAPIVLGWPGIDPAPRRVLINLDEQAPAFAGEFEHIVEPVPSGGRAASRARWKHYRDLGWDLDSHALEPGRAES
jgi:DNA polymerase-3 subunit chi